MAYLIDSNVFIDAKNRYYGFELCPGFWDWLLSVHERGRLFSIEQVGWEIRDGGDDLTEWTAERAPGLFAPSTPAVRTALRQVNDWAAGQDYKAAAVRDFAGSADCYLVAHGLAGRHSVVTLETSSRSRTRVKIPDVCAAFDVECIDTFEMLRRENARFVLGAAP